MTIIDRFLSYAAAFEEAYASDEWSKIDAFFTEDAVYETFAAPPFGNRVSGRDVIKRHFKQSCDAFDRRFDSRAVEVVAGPAERDGNVWLRWAATYHRAGAPDLRMEGEETAIFDGQRIRRLEDRIASSEGERILAYMGEHEGKLKPQG
jgi:ketosteroid isomerase-like protein